MSKSAGLPCKRCGWSAPKGQAYCDECRPWVEKWGEPVEKASKGSFKFTAKSALVLGGLFTVIFGYVMLIGFVDCRDRVEERKKQDEQARRYSVFEVERKKIVTALEGKSPVTLGDLIGLVGPYSSCISPSRRSLPTVASWSALDPQNPASELGTVLSATVASCDPLAKVGVIEIGKWGR